MLTIYCARPITGRHLVEVDEYYRRLKPMLESWGYRVLTPMVGKERLVRNAEYAEKFSGDGIAKPHSYREPTATDRAIIRRDYWMIQQADVVYAFLEGALQVSIGTCCELAWAWALRRHTVAVLGAWHEHAFLRQAADIILDDENSALEYLRKLVKGEV